MAIGENYTSDFNNSGNDQKKLFEQTFYSRLRFKNENEGNTLNISYNAGLLKIGIDQILDGFKYDNKITISLSPTKARILADQLNMMEEYIAKGKISDGIAFGVNAGMKEKVTFIAFHVNPEDNGIIITIGTFDNAGKIIDRFDYRCHTQYHYGLTWTDLNSNKLDKTYYDNTEYNSIKSTIVDFARFMSGAAAYSVMDLGRYEFARVLNKMNPIYDALHIERYSGNGGNKSFQQNSFLNNSSGVSSGRSLDQIESDFME